MALSDQVPENWRNVLSEIDSVLAVLLYYHPAVYISVV